jgi:hypothetical protein
MLGHFPGRQKRDARDRHKIILKGSKHKMTTISFRRPKASAWSRLVEAFRALFSAGVSEKWHWHGDVMRRRLADGTIVIRQPTREEMDNRDERQVR